MNAEGQLGITERGERAQTFRVVRIIEQQSVLACAFCVTAEGVTNLLHALKIVHVVKRDVQHHRQRGVEIKK